MPFSSNGLRLFTFPNGRIVETNLPSLEAVVAYEQHKDGYGCNSCEYGFGDQCRYYRTILNEAGAVPGSTWELVLKYGENDIDEELYLFLSERMKDDEERNQHINMDELVLYAKLERPRPKQRRRKPLESGHRKLRGHAERLEDESYHMAS